MSLKLFFLLGFIQGAMMTLILWLRRGVHRSNSILALLVFSLAVQLLFTGFTDDIIAWSANLRVTGWVTPFLFAPLTFLYIKSYLSGSCLRQRDILHIVPFLVSLVGVIPYFLLEESDKRAFNIFGSSYFLTFGLVYELARIIQWIVYLRLSIRIIRSYRKEAHEVISQLSLKWIWQFLAASAISWFIATVSIVLFFTGDNYSINPFIWTYLLSIVFIYLLTYILTTRPLVLEGFSNKKKYARSGFNSDQRSEYLDKMEALMNDEQLFRKPELSIIEVAELTDIPRHHLSQLINEELKMNFFEYVNRKRVNYAKELLTDSSKRHLKLLAIGYESGFNSKSSFNHLFRKYTGFTPSQFQMESGQKK